MCSNSRARQVHTQGISESDDALLVQVGSAGVVGKDHGQVRPPVSPSLVHHILQTPGQLLWSHWDAEYLQPVVWDTEHFQPVFIFILHQCLLGASSQDELYALHNDYYIALFCRITTKWLRGEIHYSGRKKKQKKTSKTGTIKNRTESWAHVSKENIFISCFVYWWIIKIWSTHSDSGRLTSRHQLIQCLQGVVHSHRCVGKACHDAGMCAVVHLAGQEQGMTPEVTLHRPVQSFL